MARVPDQRKVKRVQKAKDKIIYTHKPDHFAIPDNGLKLPQFVAPAPKKGIKSNGKIPVGKTTAAVVPAKGIYSPKWLKAIALNTGPWFERLSLDIRLKLYEVLINNIGTIEDKPVEIKPNRYYRWEDKYMGKFVDARGRITKGAEYSSWCWDMVHIGKDLNTLYLICKQVFVELHGTGLFYRQKGFFFKGAPMMMDYLATIHPISRNAITTIRLEPNIQKNSNFAPMLAFSMLNSMESLQTLHITANTKVPLDVLIKHLEKHKGLANLKGIQKFTFNLVLLDAVIGAGDKLKIKKICKQIEDANAAKYSALLKDRAQK